MSAGTGPLIRHGYCPPSKPIPPEVNKARCEYKKAKEDSRQIPAMIQEVRKRMDDPSFVANPTKYLEQWDHQIYGGLESLDMAIETPASFAHEYIAQHIVGGVLNRTALEEGLNELSSRVDACRVIIQKYQGAFK